MKYVKNTKMDFIQTDDTSLTVYDPESGDTHFFDETGTDILSFLSEPCGLEELLEKLCGVYEAVPGGYPRRRGGIPAGSYGKRGRSGGVRG